MASSNNELFGSGRRAPNTEAAGPAFDTGAYPTPSLTSGTSYLLGIAYQVLRRPSQRPKARLRHQRGQHPSTCSSKLRAAAHEYGSVHRAQRDVPGDAFGQQTPSSRTARDGDAQCPNTYTGTTTINSGVLNDRQLPQPLATMRRHRRENHPVLGLSGNTRSAPPEPHSVPSRSTRRRLHRAGRSRRHQRHAELHRGHHRRSRLEWRLWFGALAGATLTVNAPSICNSPRSLSPARQCRRQQPLG